jgi:porphobilinogen synthase
MFPATRLRRLRRTGALRDLVAETAVSLDDVIYPLFVEEGIEEPIALPTMPGIFRIPERRLSEEVRRVAAAGVRAVVLFGVSHRKDDHGSDSLAADGLVSRMVATAKAAAPEMVVISDTCFCEYTDHGHCGVLGPAGVDNDATIANLGRQAVLAADAGADIIAPSAMMDGQVAAIREALDGAGHAMTPIMSYSSKYSSGMYGPFRAAGGTSLKGDRSSYMMDMRNAREAVRESALDEAEGADILMVKPGLHYLDILAKLRETTRLPLCVYNVSGEYAMLKFAAAAGALDETRVMVETLTAFKRAGADLIITYSALDFAAFLNG